MNLSGQPAAAVTITRHLQWADTDASGHHHHSIILRWVEEAEAALLHRLRLTDQFGATPRVRYEVDYRSRLWFGDHVEIRLAVRHLGRSSLTYEFDIAGPPGCVASGKLTIVHTKGSSGGSTPWSQATRDAILNPGGSLDASTATP